MKNFTLLGFLLLATPWLGAMQSGEITQTEEVIQHDLIDPNNVIWQRNTFLNQHVVTKLDFSKLERYHMWMLDRETLELVIEELRKPENERYRGYLFENPVKQLFQDVAFHMISYWLEHNCECEK